MQNVAAPNPGVEVDKTGYGNLQTCSDVFPLGTFDCGSNTCYMEADKFYTQSVEGGTILDEGLFSGAGDVGGGILGLIFSLLIICGTLFCLVKLLHTLVMGTAKKVIMRATNMNDYVAMLVGLAITFVVQSSSVTTSTLTPLCGVGVLSVEKMLPMTLGANIGTTFTSMLAALAVMKPDSLQIAFVHLFFNITGILIWFPVPFMRQWPIKAACLLGFYASYWRLVPLIYILVMFVTVPGHSAVRSVCHGNWPLNPTNKLGSLPHKSCTGMALPRYPINFANQYGHSLLMATSYTGLLTCPNPKALSYELLSNPF